MKDGAGHHMNGTSGVCSIPFRKEESFTRVLCHWQEAKHAVKPRKLASLSNDDVDGNENGKKVAKKWHRKCPYSRN